VADRGYQFVVFEEVPDNFERSLIPSKRRGCLPSGNEQEVATVSIDYLKGLRGKYCISMFTADLASPIRCNFRFDTCETFDSEAYDLSRRVSNLLPEKFRRRIVSNENGARAPRVSTRP